jgi:hypothetical protein
MKILKKLNVKKNKIFKFKKDSKHNLTMGVLNQEIGSLLSKIEKYYKNKKIDYVNYIDYIMIYQEKIIHLNDFFEHFNITLNEDINPKIFYAINKYIDFLSKARLKNLTHINTKEELYDFLSLEYFSLNLNNSCELKQDSLIFLSEEGDSLYPSYLIKLPILPFTTVRIFALRQNGNYIFGTVYYKNNKTTLNIFENIEETIDYALNLIFENLYYKKVIDISFDDFMNLDENKFVELFKIFKY